MAETEENSTPREEKKNIRSDESENSEVQYAVPSEIKRITKKQSTYWVMI